MCRIVCLSTVLTLCHLDHEAVFPMTLRWTKTCKGAGWHEMSLNPVALVSHGLGSPVCHAYTFLVALQVSGRLRHSSGDAARQTREERRRLC
jgi:hypothetical protein